MIIPRPDTWTLGISWLIGFAILFALKFKRPPKPQITRHARQGVRVGDMLGKTNRAILIVTHIIDRNTITFRPIKYEDLPKANSFPETLAEISSQIVRDCIAENNNWLQDFVADYDRKAKKWRARNKKG